MKLEELARKTAELLYHPVDVDLNKAIILSALQEAVKEHRQDLLQLLDSTENTVALHSKLLLKYRGI